MNRLWNWAGSLGLVLLAATVVGCSPKDGDNTSVGGKSGSAKPAADIPANAPSYKIITNGVAPFWSALAKGLDVAKEERKVKADWSGPNPSGHVEQVKLFKDAMAQNVNGIAISTIEPASMASTINEAIDAHIPVISIDSDCPASKRLAYLGTNNFVAGQVAGREALKLFPNGGKLVAFVGSMGGQNARDRYDGFKDALKGSKLEFLQEPYEDHIDKTRARKNVEDAISKYGDQLTGVVGLFSYNGPAIVSAVNNANLRSKIKIICFDGEPETLNNLKKNLVDVTIVQKPYEFGRLSILLLDLIHKNNGDVDKALIELDPELKKLNMTRKDHIIDTGVTVITPANANQFIKDLEAKGLSST